MKVNKKISLALLSVALLGAGASLVESQSDSALSVVQAAKKKKTKTKTKSKAKKSTKNKKAKKTTKSKKSTKKYKKTTVSTSKIYTALFGKKSNDPTLEKYRNSMAKVIKKYSDKLNDKTDPGIVINDVYIGLKATKNSHEYFTDYPDTYGVNPVMVKGDKIKKGHSVDTYFDVFGLIAGGLKNAPKATASKADIEKILGDDWKYNTPNVGIKKLFGKYYYWVYEYDGADEDSGEEFDHCCSFYPASDFKFFVKKLK